MIVTGNYIDSVIVPRIKNHLVRIKLASNSLLYSAYLKDSDCNNISGFTPYVDLAIFIFKSKESVDIYYDYFCKFFKQSTIFKVKKWYDLLDFWKDSDSYSYKDNKVDRVLEHNYLDYTVRAFNMRKKNLFYAVEIWYSTKIILRNNYKKCTLSDILDSKE